MWRGGAKWRGRGGEGGEVWRRGGVEEGRGGRGGVEEGREAMGHYVPSQRPSGSLMALAASLPQGGPRLSAGTLLRSASAQTHHGFHSGPAACPCRKGRREKGRVRKGDRGGGVEEGRGGVEWRGRVEG